MKRRSLLTVLPLLLLAACGEPEVGNGAITTRTHALDTFNAVHTQLRLPIEIVVGAQATEVDVTLDENLQDALTFTVFEGTLNIGTERPFVPSENTQLVVHVPQLRALSAQGSGDIEVTGRQAAEPLLLEHTGEGNLTACTDASELTVRHHTAATLDVCIPVGAAVVEVLNIESRGPGQVHWEGDAVDANVLARDAASITLLGQAQTLRMDVHNASVADAAAFPVEELILETTSVGISRAHATTVASVLISSTGNVELSGNPPTVHFVRDGTGELIESP